MSGIKGIFKGELYANTSLSVGKYNGRIIKKEIQVKCGNVSIWKNT